MGFAYHGCVINDWYFLNTPSFDVSLPARSSLLPQWTGIELSSPLRLIIVESQESEASYFSAFACFRYHLGLSCCMVVASVPISQHLFVAFQEVSIGYPVLMHFNASARNFIFALVLLQKLAERKMVIRENGRSICKAYYF